MPNASESDRDDDAEGPHTRAFGYSVRPLIRAKYPADAYRGFRARLPDCLVGVPYARHLERAVRLLELKEGDCVCDVACGPGYNLSRLVHTVGANGLVTAVEDNPHLLARAQQKVERAGWQNVTLFAELDPERIERRPVDGIIIGYNPPIFLQRHDLLETAWALLKPGGRLSAVGARCTTAAGRIVGPLIKLGLAVLGHPRDWHYWTVHEPWLYLEELSKGNTSVEPKLGSEYILCAVKPSNGIPPVTRAPRGSLR